MEVAFALIGVTDVAVRASSKLWALSAAWRDAPADLHNLRDDLTRTERFFGEIQSQIKATRLVGSPLEKEPFSDQSELERLVDNGAVTLRRIEAIVDGLTSAEDPEMDSLMGKVGDLRKRRRFLWLRQSRKVARLRKELAHIRSSICRLLVTQNISMSTEIYNTLEHTHHEVRTQINDFSMSFTHSQDTLLHRFDERIQTMETRMLMAIQDDRSPTLTFRSNMNSPCRATYLTSGTQLDGAFYDTRSRSDPSPGREVNVRDSGCTCTCTCHRATSQLWRFTLLRSLLGMVAVVYNTRTSTCSSPSTTTAGCPCASRPIRDLYLAYHLPAWLARVSLSAFATTSLHGSPALNLRVYYRRSSTEALAPLGVSRLIDQGDTTRLQHALSIGRASVYDLFCAQGQTALALALNVQQPDIIRLYLQAGADPFHVDDNGGSAVATAFQTICSGVGNHSQDGKDRECAEVLAPAVRKYVEEVADFGVLHDAVLTGADLGAILAKMGEEGVKELNRKSREGWTPLHLAAMKGNARATRVLVRAGAEIECRAAGAGATPLYFACRYGHPEVVTELLNGGADVNSADRLGRRAIHAAGATLAGREVIEAMVKHGADLQGRGPGEKGYPPLMCSVIWGPLDAVECMLERGADIHGTSHADDTMMAIRVARHEKVRFLLRKGAAVCGKDKTGRNVLHHLASNGDEEMIRLFTGIDGWRKWDPMGLTEKDMFGLTPLALFNQRNPGGELRQAFERLMDWVGGCASGEENEMNGWDGEEDEEDGEVFYDADDGELRNGASERSA